jgi:hypothetical protein
MRPQRIDHLGSLPQHIARAMLHRSTGLHADPARRPECHNLAAPDSLPDDDFLGRVNTVTWNAFLAVSKPIVVHLDGSLM